MAVVNLMILEGDEQEPEGWTKISKDERGCGREVRVPAAPLIGPVPGEVVVAVPPFARCAGDCGLRFDAGRPCAAQQGGVQVEAVGEAGEVAAGEVFYALDAVADGVDVEVERGGGAGP